MDTIDEQLTELEVAADDMEHALDQQPHLQVLALEGKEFTLQQVSLQTWFMDLS